MSRYIVNIDSLWEHNTHCELCRVIDIAYDAIADPQESQDAVDRLEQLLVNGYDLVAVKEANADVDEASTTDLKNIVMYDDAVVAKALANVGVKVAYDPYNAKLETAMFGRWCRDCGARKPSIVNTHLLVNVDDYSFSATPVGRTVNLSWIVGEYKFGQRVVVTRVDDRGDAYLELVNSSKLTAAVDTVPEDGRVYTYTCSFVDECSQLITSRVADVLIPVDEDHTPLNINAKFVKHTHLALIDGKYEQREYVRIDYQKPVDPNFGRVVVKLNVDHEPGIDFWASDLEFTDAGIFEFPDKTTRYFTRTLVESRVFKRDGVDDHDRFPDLFFYNSSSPATMVRYVEPQDDLYALTFADDRRSMTINYSLRVGTTARHVRVMFKQSDAVITDDDDGTYKVVDVPVLTATYDYCVSITGLAANSFWVFGVFPVYVDADPEIRLDFQTIVKIRPWFQADQAYTVNDFYYTGRWQATTDFTDYNLADYSRITHVDARQHRVMTCEHINPSDVAVLLVHDDDVAEQFKLSYDYKLISRNNDDQLNAYVNHHRTLTTTTSSGCWFSFEDTYTNASFLIARWEQLKLSTQPWTCTFVDGVHLLSETVVDVDVDNFTRSDEMRFKEYYYFNRTIKYDASQQFTPKKYYCVDIKIDPYFTDDGKRVGEVAINGN